MGRKPAPRNARGIVGKGSPTARVELREIAFRKQIFIQGVRDGGRPARVKTFPVTLLAKRRMEVIQERHCDDSREAGCAEDPFILHDANE